MDNSQLWFVPQMQPRSHINVANDTQYTVKGGCCASVLLLLFQLRRSTALFCHPNLAALQRLLPILPKFHTRVTTSPEKHREKDAWSLTYLSDNPGWWDDHQYYNCQPPVGLDHEDRDHEKLHE